MPMNNQIPSGPIYSVDFHSEASGKRVGATKRRIRWRFGFANVHALNQGLTGVDCRGEEHEVVLVWSLTSGKRLVVADGQEVHFSMGRRAESKFETSFSMFGNHIFKIVAYAAPPLTPQPGFRQFDLQMDGMSFGTFTKIFELGIRSGPPRLAREQYSMTAYHHSDESRDFAMSRDNRFEYEGERRRTPVPITPEAAPRAVVKNVEPAHAPTPPVVAAMEDLLSSPNNNTNDQGDLLWDAAPQLTYQAPTQQQQQHQQAPAQHSAVQTYYQPQVTPQNNNHYYYQQQSPRGVADEFAPVPPPPRTFQDVSKEILSAYTPDPSIPALTYTPHYSNEVYYASSGMATVEERGAKDVTPDNRRQNNAVLVPTMQPLSIVEMQERDQPLLSEMEKAVKTLVNLDDITETLETPEQVKTVRNKERSQPAKSKPLPPSKPAWNLGLRPCLGDMQQNPQPKAAPKKEIMRTHAFDPAAVQAGMMVLYGATATASSIPAASGFGAGVYYNNNWQQQQQHQRMYAAY